MEDKIEILLKKLIKNSTTLLYCHKDFDSQLDLAQRFARIILNIASDKPYKTHPDVLGIWPENIAGRTIKIDQIHDFIRSLQLKPYVAKYKVGIIISAEKMNEESQNALLKTLEEPPPNTFLLLTTINKEKLLSTIISRCKIIETENKNKSPIDLKLIQEILKGNILERFKLVENITQQKDKNKRNEDIYNLLDNLLFYLENSLLEGKKDQRESISLIDLVESTKNALEKNVNARLALENLMINLPFKDSYL